MIQKKFSTKSVKNAARKGIARHGQRAAAEGEAASRASKGSNEPTKPRFQAASAAKSNTDAEDWRRTTLAHMRALILKAEPAMSEERKWRKPSNPAGVPVWSHNGVVCTGEIYKSFVKLTFAKGASLPDPSRLFNASLDGGTRRAIDIRQAEQVNAAAFKALVKAAVALNRSKT